MDKLSLGPVPAEERCEQLRINSYNYVKAQEECERYISGLLKFFGAPPRGVSFKVDPCRHDYGTYLQVFIHFDGNDEQAVTWAYKVEAEAPSSWEELEGNT